MRNNEIVRLGLILCAITVAVAFTLAIGNLATEDKIEKLNEQAQNEARKAVLPSAESFEQFNIDEVGKDDYEIVNSVFVGKTGSKIVGYSIGVTPGGFGGDIQMIVGIDKDGKVTGVHIVSDHETPGLGSNAKEPKFKDQYIGKSTDTNLEVIKNGVPKENEVIAISGATVSSKAVTKGVNTAINIYKEKIIK